MIALLLVAASVWCLGRAARRPAPLRANDGAGLATVTALTRRVPMPAGLVGALGGPSEQQRLVEAGLAELVRPYDVAHARLVLAVAGFPFAALGAADPVLLPVGLLAGLLGWLAPGFIVGRSARARQQAIVRQLPDVLDLLGVCVEAGMALDPALRTVAARLSGPMGVELDRVLADLETGATRARAYRDLATRVNTPELDAVVGGLITADTLGTPLTRGLREQAVSLRSEMAQRARDRAARAAPRMQLVVAMLMVPAVLLIVVTVMGTELARQMGPVFGGIE